MVVTILQFMLLSKINEIEQVEDLMMVKSTGLVGYLANVVIDGTSRKILTILALYAVVFVVFSNDTITALTGALSGLLEAILPIPQLYNNYKRKSVESLR